MQYKLLVLFCFLFSGISLAQIPIPTEEELKNGTDEQKIEAAEYFFEQKLYFQSERIWQNLLIDYSDNPRINYMAGKCQFLSGANKNASLKFFEKTIGHISNKNKLDSRHFTEVPADALFYLGKSSHLNQKFDDALKYYDQYLQKLGSKIEPAEKTEVERWRTWTNNAKIQVANPNNEIVITNLGPEINTVDEEYSPVISLDENIIYFTSRRLRADSSNKGILMIETGNYYEDVYLSFREENGKWAAPKLMNFGNYVDDNEATVSVSADGTEVFVYFDKEGGGDLYTSSFLEGGYNAQLEHITGDINSDSWETHCTLTPDGNTMFFTSNRPGGFGGLDIYRVIKLPNGQWSKAEILPPPINTPFDEDAPFIHPSGNVLYYSSNANTSMGGCDVFYSRLISKEPLQFSEPINMGYPLNTVDDDVFFVMDAEGKTGYYSSSQNGGYGAHDILMVEFKKPVSEPFAILKGHIMMVDHSQIPDNLNVTITNLTKESQDLNFKPRKIDGGFVMALEPCTDYQVEYFIGEKSVKTDKFKVLCKDSYQEIRKEVMIDTLFLAIDMNNLNNVKTDSVIVAEPVKKTYFEKYFDYNLLDVNVAEQKYNAFISDIKQIIANKGKAEVFIESSASNVPTSKFKNNQNLSISRAEETKLGIIESLKKAGVSESSLVFKEPKTLIQGPPYNNDYLQNKRVYGKFQYIKVWVE
jgi:WD40-like Beta Propeller Repeat